MTRRAVTWLELALIVLLWTSSWGVMASDELKIAEDLRAAIKADPAVRSDIMVQLESPEQVLARECNDSEASRGDKASCLVGELQQFADAAQQQVRDLLDRESGEYTDSTFFWINNSVSVKKASGALVLALAQLDTVLGLRAEEIFHTLNSNGDTQKKKIGLTF